MQANIIIEDFESFGDLTTHLYELIRQIKRQSRKQMPTKKAVERAIAEPEPFEAEDDNCYGSHHLTVKEETYDNPTWSHPDCYPEEKRSADPWYLLKYIKNVLEREFPVEDIINFIVKKLNEHSCATQPASEVQPIADGKAPSDGCGECEIDYIRHGARAMQAFLTKENNELKADLLAARNKNNDDGIEIARLLAGKKKWETRCLDAENNLTAMIDEALQKGKELDALAPEIKRQTIDRLYNEILAAGVEFPPAAREVFHRAMNELTASPTQNPNK